MDPKTLNLDPDRRFWPNLDPDSGPDPGYTTINLLKKFLYKRNFFNN